jgi:hypothetical protein
VQTAGGEVQTAGVEVQTVRVPQLLRQRQKRRGSRWRS